MIRINDEGSETFSIECGLLHNGVFRFNLIYHFDNDITLALEFFVDDLGALFIRTNIWEANKMFKLIKKIS